MAHGTASDLLESLCRSLAFHVVETELTIQFCDGDVSEIADEIAKAKSLIAQAGFSLDVLYPPEDRPVAGPPVQ